MGAYLCNNKIGISRYEALSFLSDFFLVFFLEKFSKNLNKANPIYELRFRELVQ
jgi:hypothetical protein